MNCTALPIDRRHQVVALGGRDERHRRNHLVVRVDHPQQQLEMALGRIDGADADDRLGSRQKRFALSAPCRRVTHSISPCRTASSVSDHSPSPPTYARTEDRTSMLVAPGMRERLPRRPL
jgi:hypothetical protein